MITLTIPGKPVPAVRMTGRGAHVKPNAKRYLDYKSSVGWLAKSQYKQPPMTANVAVNVTFYIHGKVRGDIDNLFKSVTDGLNKIIYKDDKQITQAVAEIKSCDKDEDHVVIEIKEARKGCDDV
ncbi:RusA family crossover junction endodeoxyribonuclease [Alkalicoccus chagannorensis]|uniref:RusA family crossover junction endodeoxyribonuclease n=1 Tax=Alkalicoccus chagannorensis TaxID=427072 RepID=UPI000478786C|nr:RusA family crossover junction endodeoxyribonuclease [Alkalicoccus chagannorensis]